MRVKSWTGGKLKGLDIQFEITKPLASEDYRKIMGGQVNSKSPILKKAKLKVKEFGMNF